MTCRVQNSSPDPSVLASSTLVLWSTCLVVGIVERVWHPADRPTQKVPPVELIAEVLHVESIKVSAAPDSVSPAPPTTATARVVPQPTPPPAPALAVIPAAPAWMALREPAAAKSPPPFVVPVQAAAPVSAETSPKTDSQSSGIAAPEVTGSGKVDDQGPGTGAPERLIYGQGEGKQPAPRYPARARSAGQQGTVLVLFTVGENGRVLTSEITQPSPWPLLNDEALRTVRDWYRFQPGRFRLYEIAIRFELGK